MVILPPRGPVNRRVVGSAAATSSLRATISRTSSMSGTMRARLPLVPLSMRPPGLGVVCRRTVYVQDRAVDVADANARHFTYSSRSAGSEDHYVAPTLKFAGGALHERSSKRYQ